MAFRLELREKTPFWFNIVLPLSAVMATLLLCSGLLQVRMFFMPTQNFS